MNSFKIMSNSFLIRFCPYSIRVRLVFKGDLTLVLPLMLDVRVLSLLLVTFDPVVAILALGFWLTLLDGSFLGDLEGPPTVFLE